MKLKKQIEKFQKDIPNVLSKFRSKNIETTKWISGLCTELSRRENLSKSIVFSDNQNTQFSTSFDQHQHNYLSNQDISISDTIPFKTTFSNDDSASNFLKSSSLISNYIVRYLVKIEKLLSIEQNISALFSDMKAKIKVINSTVNFSEFDFGKISDLFDQFKKIYDQCIDQSIEIENLPLQINNLHDFRGHLTKNTTSKLIHDLTSVNKSFQTIKDAFKKMTQLNNMNTKHSMRILVKNKETLSHLSIKGLTYNNVFISIRQLKKEIKALVYKIVEKIRILFSFSSHLGESIKIMILDNRMKTFQTYNNTKKKLFETQQMDMKKLNSLINNDQMENGAGYNLKDNLFIGTVLKQDYPNSIKSLIKINRLKNENVSIETERMTINNINVERNFDLIFNAFKEFYKQFTTDEKMDETYQSIIRLMNRIVNIMEMQDDTRQRVEYSDNNEFFVEKFDILQKLKSLTSSITVSNQEILQNLLDEAMIFEIKLEILRIHNQSRVTESEFSFLDKAVKIMTNTNFQNEKIIEIVKLLPDDVSSIIKTINMVESNSNGKKVSISKYFMDIENSKRAVEMEREIEVKNLAVLHQASTRVDYRLHQMYDNHRVVIHDTKTQELFITLMENDFKTDVLIVESLFRFIIENDIGIETIANESTNNLLVEIYQKTKTYCESESIIIENIMNNISNKLKIVDQMNSFLTHNYNKFHPIRVKIVQLLKEKETLHYSTKNSLISIFRQTKFDNPIEIIKREYSFIDKETGLIDSSVWRLKNNFKSIDNTIEFILFTFFYIRLLKWKSYFMEIDSRQINYEI